jgi:hypothetical protein
MDNMFVTYEIALMLKEKGFDEPCFGTYNSFGDFIQSNSEEPLPKNSDQLYDHIWLKHIQTHFPEHTPEMLCTAPLWQQCLEWLEREHWVDFWAVPILTPNPKQYECFIMYRGKEISCDILGIRFFNSYNDARQTAVEKILKHI